MQNRDRSVFTYCTSFSKPELTAGEQLLFVPKGINYQFKILLNGEEMLSHEGKEKS